MVISFVRPLPLVFVHFYFGRLLVLLGLHETSYVLGYLDFISINSEAYSSSNSWSSVYQIMPESPLSVSLFTSTFRNIRN